MEKIKLIGGIIAVVIVATLVLVVMMPTSNTIIESAAVSANMTHHPSGWGISETMRFTGYIWIFIPAAVGIAGIVMLLKSKK